MATPAYLKHLQKDKQLASVIERIGLLELSTKENIFLWLTRNIASQQLSTQVADILFGRLLNLIGKRKFIPKNILAITIEQLRSIGFSYAKCGYIHNIATFWIENKVTDEQLYKLDDKELIDFLTQIKGVGKWTVEMLLMFALGRENIFSVDDLGIQQGMAKLYKWNPSSKKELKEKMLRKAKSYEPYCTYACKYIWRYKDTN